jgi:hypothetical protein
MGLREEAENDLAIILEDEDGGFAWPITLIGPDGLSATFSGFSNDVAQFIDPDTGQAVSGRIASVTLRNSSLYAAGFSLPRGIADSDSKPWRVKFDDINGIAYEFKVSQADPDRALGVTVCMLELYK